MSDTHNYPEKRKESLGEPVSATKLTVDMPNQLLKAARLLVDQSSIGTLAMETKPRLAPLLLLTQCMFEMAWVRIYIAKGT